MSSVRILLAICAGSFFMFATAPASASLMYVPGLAGDSLGTLETGDETALIPRTGSSIGAGFAAFVPAPHGKFAFAAFSSGGVRAFGFAADTGATPIQAALDSPALVGVALAPDGRTLYGVAGGSAGGIFAWSVGDNGLLTELAGSPFDATADYRDVVLSSAGDRLFAAGDAKIQSFSVAGGGALVAAVSIDASAEHLLIPRPGLLVATINGAVRDSLVSFTIDSGGIVQVGPGLDTASTQAGAPVSNADGEHIYLCDEQTGEIYSTSVALTGLLSQSGPAVALPGCKHLIVSTSGYSVYAVKTGVDAGMYRGYVESLSKGAIKSFRRHWAADLTGVAPLSFRPGQGAVAVVKVSHGGYLEYKLDGSASYTPTGPSSRYRDIATYPSGSQGGSGRSQNSSFQFDKAGIYDVTYWAIDADWCSGFVYDGHSVRCNGSDRSIFRTRIDTLPEFRSIKWNSRRITRNLRIRFRTTESARIRFSVWRETTGRKVGGKCKKLTAKNKRGRKCAKRIDVRKRFVTSSRSTKWGSVPFKARRNGKQLPLGQYVVRAVPTDKRGNVGPTEELRFLVNR